jgi:translation elongation factor EF-G
MDKITQALKKVLPAEHVAEVSRAVEEVMAERFEEMEQEFQDKLTQAYEQLTEEKKADESTAYQGYQQAYEIISSLMNRLDEQRIEFENALEEGFEEAFNELQREKGKNGNIEVELYDEFNKKLAEMKDIMVDKIDQFMTLQEQEIYEAAKRDVLSDPRILEQRVAVERMAEILSDYISTDDLAGVSSNKIEEASRQIEALKGQLRIVEAKNVKLSAQKNRLEEQVREANECITEATRVERKQRVNRRGIASGRGQRVVNEQLISEYAAAPTNNSASGRELVEAHDPLNDLLVLSGLEETR